MAAQIPPKPGHPRPQIEAGDGGPAPRGENLHSMRRVVVVALGAMLSLALLAPAKAEVPVEWLESGGTLFAGGGTNLC